MSSPSWKITESVFDKPPSKVVNEDRFGCAGRLAWIIDGATGLSDYPVTTEESDADWLVDVITEVLTESAADVSLGPAEIIRRAIGVAAARSVEEWSAVPEFPPSAAIAVLAADDDGVDYALLADVTIALADGSTISDHRVDALNSPAQERLDALLGDGVSFDDARTQINDLLVAARVNGMNKPGGYWVAADDPAAADNAVTGRLACDQCSELVLSTDGFARAVELFDIEPDWKAMVSGARPLVEVLEKIRTLEADESSLSRFPRWSRSDDATAARLELQ